MNFNIDELQLIHFADPIMSSPPPEFDFEKDGDKAEELFEVLYNKMIQLGGVGLSANQVGLPYKVFVFGNETEKQVMFNPVVVGASKEITTMSEGCLSFPDLVLSLKRPAEVVIRFQDVKGESQIAEAKGVVARIILHEYDHMMGINFTHHASNFKLKMELDKIKRNRQKLLARMAVRNGR